MKRISRNLTRTIALVAAIVMIATTTIFATAMKDVSNKHWAYNEIMEMQKRGLLVTSSQGEFFPNSYVTYFEFSQILAKATGYQDASINPNMDPALKKTIDTNFANQKSIIESHQKNYKHWQKDANGEIAYLLGKGYLTKEDLGKFMTKSTSGVESKRGVRKQEAALYLVRILHKAETAKGEYTSTGFADEAKIESAYRPYVAYMKNLGIVNGNEKGEFGPVEPITRATLSKMLIDTLKIKEAPETPVNPTPTPEQPALPKDKALEGKFTKMISKGNDGYYIVIEVEPGQPPYTYSIEPTASVVDNKGTTVSLPELKNKIDTRGNEDVIITAQVEVIGTTEYITKVKIMEEPTQVLPPVVKEPEDDEEEEKPVRPSRPDRDEETEELYNGRAKGTIHSILIAPNSEVTINIDSRTQKTFKINIGTKIYSNPKRKDVAIWDLRLNQEVDANVKDGEVITLDITKPAPAVTLTGTIEKVSTNGDAIEIRIPYDQATDQTNRIRTVNVPMPTQIIEGTTERGRKDLKKGMEVVVVYGQDEEVIPEKIIIISK